VPRFSNWICSAISSGIAFPLPIKIIQRQDYKVSAENKQDLQNQEIMMLELRVLSPGGSHPARMKKPPKVSGQEDAKKASGFLTQSDITHNCEK